MKAAYLLTVLAACGYSHAEVPQVEPAAHARVGCLDVDLVRTAQLPSPLVTYRFANACDHEATMVMSKLRAVAVTPDGDYQELAVDFSHPHRYAYRVDAHESDVAELFYRGGGLPQDSHICVDLGTADDALSYTPRWTCVRY